jgi:hypothetical protein
MAIDQRSIQQNIQGQLPVIPNNGNPAGAYNMPQMASVGAAPPVAPPNPYQWVEPSQSMVNVRQMLAKQAERIAFEAEHPTNNTGFNLITRPDGFNLMPVDDTGLPLSRQVPIVPLRTQQQINQNPNDLVLPTMMNP